MALRYCSLHQRLFAFKHQTWVYCSPETIDEIRGYDELLRATPTAASSLKVLETACDQCAATFRQIARVNGETRTPHRRKP